MRFTCREILYGKLSEALRCLGCGVTMTRFVEGILVEFETDAREETVNSMVRELTREGAQR